SKIPKTLLKGVTDRLKQTGLAKSVKVTDSVGVQQELAKRSGYVSFQNNGFNVGSQQDRDLFNSFNDAPILDVLNTISEKSNSDNIKIVAEALKKSASRLSEFRLMTGDFPWRGLTENGRITIN